MLAALAAGHLLLIPAAGSLLSIGAVVTLGGAAIAPTYAAVYAMADKAAPAGSAAEAFAWLATAVHSEPPPGRDWRAWSSTPPDRSAGSRLVVERDR